MKNYVCLLVVVCFIISGTLTLSACGESQDRFIGEWESVAEKTLELEENQEMLSGYALSRDEWIEHFDKNSLKSSPCSSTRTSQPVDWAILLTLSRATELLTKTVTSLPPVLCKWFLVNKTGSGQDRPRQSIVSVILNTPLANGYFI